MANDDIEATLRLNTLAPIVLTKYVARGMMAAGRGGSSTSPRSSL